MRFLFLLCLATALVAGDESALIRKVLEEQQQAWNAGDLQRFMQGYENSPDITFVGKDVSRGYQSVLTRYLRNYGSQGKADREMMGVLTFSEIEVKMLGPAHALIIGRFALERSPAGGGPASGRYTLIARKTKDGWKLIHDHTS